MNLKEFEAKFPEYLDGRLSGAEREDFRKALDANPDFRDALSRYQQVIQLEEAIAEEKFQLSENFVVKVMDEIEKSRPGFIWRFIMKLLNPGRPAMAAFGSCAVIALCVAVFWEQEKEIGSVLREPVPAKIAPKEELLDTASEFDGRGAPTPLLVEKAPRLESVPSASDKTSLSNLTSSLKDKADASQVAMADLRKRIIEAEEQMREREYLIAELTDPSVMQGLSESPQTRAPEFKHIGVDRYVAVSPQSNERYHEVSENKPIRTTDEAISTFSIDVDTGSYTNARRFLKSGQLPPSESVRIEEFINYFDYDYPVQGEKPFSMNYEIAPDPFNKETYLLKIGVQARDVSEREEAKPWNLVFLVDVSGSMSSPDKLPLVQRSLELLAKQMRPDDTVSIVTYAGSSGVVLEPTKGREKQKILSVIRNFQSGGSTHGSAGIQQAYQLAKEGFLENGVNRVVLATDGDFNVGVTNRDDLISLIEKKRREGITLTTLGYGTGNYNEAVMEQLANKGNGNYFYIDSFQEARKVFEQDLFGTIEVVAKDVKLQIEFNPEHVAQYRLVGYENRKLNKEDFANDKIDAGEIGSGHRVTALYQLVLTGTDAEKRLDVGYRYQKAEKAQEMTDSSSAEFAKELAMLKVRFKQPNGNTSELLEFPLERAKVKTELNEASDDYKFAAAVSAFAHLLRESQYGPEASFSEIAELASQSRGEDPHGYRSEFFSLVKNASAIGEQN